MGLALGEVTVAKGVCTRLRMCFVMKAPLLQEFLTLEGERFTDSLEMLAKLLIIFLEKCTMHTRFYTVNSEMAC